MFRSYVVAGLLLLTVGCSHSEEKVVGSGADETVTLESLSDPNGAEVAAPPAPAPPSEPPPLELQELPVPEGDADTYSISQVMQFAHDNRLFRRLMNDSPDMVAAERLLLLYEALAKQKSPKGEAESWEKRTAALVTATKAVIEGDPKGTTSFKKAVNCNGCHSNHRP